VSGVADAAPAIAPAVAGAEATETQAQAAVWDGVQLARTFSYTFTKTTTAAMYSAVSQGQAALKLFCGHLSGTAQFGCNLVADFAAHVLAGLGAPDGRCLQVFTTWKWWPPRPVVGLHYVHC
jgi:hypothetical protein